MIRTLLLLTSLIVGGLALAMGGTAPFARLALGLGAPKIAAVLFEDEAWRGVSLHRAGEFAEAARSFTASGEDDAFNLGNALAFQGRYAAALEAYDVALAHNPDDAAARANFDLVTAFYAGTKIEAGSMLKWSSDKEGPTVAADTAQGNARAAATGDNVTNMGTLVGLPELKGGNDRRVRKVFDDKFVVASPRWLATLEDVPGAYLGAQIAHEHKRRKKAGIGQKEAEDPE